jgi:hypothetical protein
MHRTTRASGGEGEHHTLRCVRWLGKQDCSCLPAYKTDRDSFPSISSSRHGVIVRTTSDLPSGMSLVVAVSMQRSQIAQLVVAAQ